MKKGLKYFLFSEIWSTLAVGMIGPIYALFVLELGRNLLDASFAYFSFMISAGIVIFLISKWEKRLEYQEKLLTLGYVLTSIGCFSYIFVHSQLTLIITQIILGIAQAVLFSVGESFYFKYLEKKHKVFGWGTRESLYFIISGLAALLGGIIATKYDFRLLFVIMFIISLFSIFSSFTLYQKKSVLNKK